MIHFTKHANEKFDILREHRFVVTKNQVIKTIESPDRIDRSRYPLYIAQRKMNATHVLRVVYKMEGSNKIIITFYPGRRNQYE